MLARAHTLATRLLAAALLAWAACSSPPTSPDAGEMLVAARAQPSAVRLDTLPRLLQTMAIASTVSPSGNKVGGETRLVGSTSGFATLWTRASEAAAWVVSDLRPLLPPAVQSRVDFVNDAGVVVVWLEVASAAGRYQYAALTGAGTVYHLGTDVVVTSLSPTGEMAGVQKDPAYAVPDRPLYWSAPDATAEALPPLDPGYLAQARWIHGTEVFGTADDAAGSWLVRWTWGVTGWTIARVTALPGTFQPWDLSASGRLVGRSRTCTTSCGMFDWRATSWAAPWNGAPAALPTVAGTYSLARAVNAAGLMAGYSVARNGRDALPVIWPTASSVQQLPLPVRGTGGAVNAINDARHLVGYVMASTASGTSQTYPAFWTLP